MLQPVLITGGAGFLGRHVAAALAAAGAGVTVLDTLRFPSSTFDSEELRHPRIRCIRGDTRVQVVWRGAGVT